MNMKKIIFIISFVLVSTVGFSQKESLKNSLSDTHTETVVDESPEIHLNYTFNNVESLKSFNTEKIGEINYEPYYNNNGENCEVTGNISITVSGSLGSSLLGGGIDASVTVSLSVTASCSEIAEALKNLAATAKAIALAQLMI